MQEKLTREEERREILKEDQSIQELIKAQVELLGDTLPADVEQEAAAALAAIYVLDMTAPVMRGASGAHVPVAFITLRGASSSRRRFLLCPARPF